MISSFHGDGVRREVCLIRESFDRRSLSSSKVERSEISLPVRVFVHSTFSSRLTITGHVYDDPFQFLSPFRPRCPELRVRYVVFPTSSLYCLRIEVFFVRISQPVLHPDFIQFRFPSRFRRYS